MNGTVSASSGCPSWAVYGPGGGDAVRNSDSEAVHSMSLNIHGSHKEEKGLLLEVEMVKGQSPVEGVVIYGALKGD